MPLTGDSKRSSVVGLVRTPGMGGWLKIRSSPSTRSSSSRMGKLHVGRVNIHRSFRAVFTQAGGNDTAWGEETSASMECLVELGANPHRKSDLKLDVAVGRSFTVAKTKSFGAHTGPLLAWPMR